MSEVDPTLFQRWGHSFEEENTGHSAVFRPADFDFPRARGRSAIEFRPDGTFIDWAIAAGDGSDAHPGRWTVNPTGQVVVTGSNGIERAYELVPTGDGIAELRSVAVSASGDSDSSGAPVMPSSVTPASVTPSSAQPVPPAHQMPGGDMNSRS